jgi:hypothetical protein
MGVMRSLAGVLGGAAYAAGVSGASQNPWAGPQALAQLRQQGVDIEMKKMQKAAYLEKNRRQASIMAHMQENFSDISDPNQRQAAIQYLVNQGAYQYAEKAAGIFSGMFGDDQSGIEHQRAMDLETHKSGLRKEEETHEVELEQKFNAGTLDYKDVSKMGADYSRDGGMVFRTLESAVARIRTGYDFYLNATTDGEKAQAYQTMVVALNKLLDPNSVVRESEFERTATYQSLENKLKSALELMKTGAPVAEVMAGVATMGEALYRAGAELQAPVYERYSARAERYFQAQGPEDVLGGFSDPREILAKLAGSSGDAQAGPIPAPAPGSGTTATAEPLEANSLMGTFQPTNQGSTGNSGFTITEIPE